MQYGRRSTDFPKQKAVTGIFYYLALSTMLGLLGLALYWQLEPDYHEIEYKELEFVSTPQNRAFFVPIYFCASNLTEFTLIRAYHDVDREIWYAVPDGKYKTGSSGCFDTRVQAHTGRLDAGNYEYHVSVSYELNPLRTIQRKVALVRVTVE